MRPAGRGWPEPTLFQVIAAASGALLSLPDRDRVTCRPATLAMWSTTARKVTGGQREPGARTFRPPVRNSVQPRCRCGAPRCGPEQFSSTSPRIAGDRGPPHGEVRVIARNPRISENNRYHRQLPDLCARTFSFALKREWCFPQYELVRSPTEWNSIS